MNGWDELVADALVGTARRPPGGLAAAPGSALAEALAGIDAATDPEGALLAAGAALGLYRQAGWRPPTDDEPLPPPSPDDERPHCSEAAAERLDAMVEGRFRPVLPEWLALVAAAGHLVPADRLPALLDTATASPALRAPARGVAGERGRWLAGQNPAWAWAAGGSDATSWATGTRAARRLLLARLRAEDADAARALLESTWATESADDRAALLGELAAGLSMADEPFLEAALDDRGREVRRVAAELLWRLPESRLAGRMAGRAHRLVRGAEIVLPDEIDTSMIRDGIVARPPAGVGERAWWLEQVVAASPLSIWPLDVLDGDPPPVLRTGWATAAVRQRDRAWASALLPSTWAVVPDLLGVVRHDEAQRVATEVVDAHGLGPPVLALLDHCPRPWGVDLSRAVVARVVEAAQQPGRPRGDAAALRARLGDLGARLDPSVAPAEVDVAPEWADVVGWFLDLLAFRAAMREELPS